MTGKRYIKTAVMDSRSVNVTIEELYNVVNCIDLFIVMSKG